MPIYGPPGTSPDYVQSRGAQLVTNGTGSTLDNTNFSAFDYDPTDVPQVGVFGSFQGTDMNVTKTSDEFIPVDPGKFYRLSMYTKTATAGPTITAGYACYDMDYQNILTNNSYHYAVSETTLAADLVDGATSFTLTDASGWVTSGSDSALIGFFPYVSAGGYVYPDYYYTRAVYRFGATNMGGVSRTGNVITAGSGYAYSGATMPAGTKVAQMFATLANQYNVANALAMPTTWTQMTGMITGLGVPNTGTTDASNAALLRPGTAAIRPLFRLNVNSYAGGVCWIAGVTADGDYRAQYAAVTYTNGWATASGTSVAYRLEYGGVVRLRGQMSGGTVSTTTTGNAFTLPVGFRPGRTDYRVVRAGTTASVAHVQLSTDGTVRVVAGDNTLIALDGIAFSTT